MVVNRRLGEEIVIDGNIRITVVKIRRSQIVLGLTAPASVRIHRPEGMSPCFERSECFEVFRESSLEKLPAPTRGGFSMKMINMRLGEEVMIDGNIRITVGKIKESRIRLGLTAPASVQIHRLEELSPHFESSEEFEVHPEPSRR